MNPQNALFPCCCLSFKVETPPTANGQIQDAKRNFGQGVHERLQTQRISPNRDTENEDSSAGRCGRNRALNTFNCVRLMTVPIRRLVEKTLPACRCAAFLSCTSFRGSDNTWGWFLLWVIPRLLKPQKLLSCNFSFKKGCF